MHITCSPAQPPPASRPTSSPCRRPGRSWGPPPSRISAALPAASGWRSGGRKGPLRRCWLRWRRGRRCGGAATTGASSRAAPDWGREPCSARTDPQDCQAGRWSSSKGSPCSAATTHCPSAPLPPAESRGFANGPSSTAAQTTSCPVRFPALRATTHCWAIPW